MKPLVIGTDLRVHFHSRKSLFFSQTVKAVDGVSVEIGESETLALVGESGCGKTTLGRAMLRLVEPTAGGIEFDGRNVLEMGSKELRDFRRDAQAIFQDPYSSMSPYMSVAEIVEEPLKIHRLPGSVETALKQVQMATVFTTHTPVPAGHDRYQPKMAAKWLRRTMQELGLNAKQLADLGREVPGDQNEPLCMTVLALRTSERVNGVAALHGEVSRQMWQRVYFPDATSQSTAIASGNDLSEVPIGHITNGIHPQTWMAPAAADLYRKRLQLKTHGAGPAAPWWGRVDKISDEELWQLRGELRAGLIHFLRDRARDSVQRHGGTSAQALHAISQLDPDTLTLGFARRFATYKRAPLIFKDAKRLAAILGDAKMPMQLVFAGKAHPRDKDGQEYAQQIHRMTQRLGFRGKVLLLEEYDMEVGRMLTSGCDVWLNTPIRPHEASGTSGMKPPLHGGLNCSILDGWWPEGYEAKKSRRNGWAIGDGAEYKSQARQDRADAVALYELLEKEIGPAFYTRGRNGLPKQWLELMRASMKSIPEKFSSHRMVAEYMDLYSG